MQYQFICIAFSALTQLGIRKSIRPVKNLGDEVLAWLSVSSEVQMICICPTTSSLISFGQGSAVADNRVMCCIMTNVLQANKIDAQCGKLAMELSWQCFASKVANFQLPHLHLTYSTCIWRFYLSFAEIFSVKKLESRGYHVALFAWSYI